MTPVPPNQGYSPWFVSLLTHKGLTVAWDGGRYHITLKDAVIVTCRPIVTDDKAGFLGLTVEHGYHKAAVMVDGYARCLRLIDEMWTLAQSATRLPRPGYERTLSSTDIRVTPPIAPPVRPNIRP